MMKRLLAVALLALGALVGYNYVTTGEIKVLPSAAPTAGERQLAELEDRFEGARKQLRQAGRAASLSGVDTTSDAEAARRSVQQVEKALQQLRGQLESTSAKSKAESLARAIKDFYREFG